MNKKLLAILLSLVMIIGLIPATSVFALPNSTATFTVKADKTEVNPGDTINFSVEMQQTGNINTMEATISLPDGLTLVPGSLTTINRSELGWDDFGLNESALLFSGYGSVSYTGTEPVVVANFQCVVDADAVGKYTVTLIDYVADDENYDTKNPTVVGKEIDVIVPVTGVTLDQETLSLDTGDNKTATLVATVDPNKATNKAVTWKSDDETIATVVDGVVTAVKHGTTTITVKTVDGGFTDVCVVTIACAHTSKTPIAAKIANCQEGGWDAYFTCDACGQLFAADGTSKISAIPTTGKNGNNHTDIQPFAADPATCVHQGHDAYSMCMDCGVVTEGSDTKYFGQHNYGTLVPAVAEKHTNDTLSPAVAAYYQCSVCQKYFTEAKVETTMAELTGATPSHTYGDWVTTDADQHWKECGCGNKIEVNDHNYDNTCDTTCNTCGHVRAITHTWSSTWSTDGINHWKDCTVCHNARNEEGAHTGGTATCQAKKECTVCHLAYGDFADCDYVENPVANHLVSDATCVAKAVYKKSCSVCGTAHATQTFKHGNVNASNHVGETEIREAEPASCDDPGYTGDTWCKDCNTKIKDGEVIPAGHKTTEVSAKPASHEADGNIKYYTCSGCSLLFVDADAKTVIEAKDTVVAKGEHSYSEAYVADAENHWKECACGSKIEKAAHTYGEWTVTKESTTTEKGSKEKTCSVCNYKITEELPLVETTNANTASPQTGNNSPILVWTMLIMISAFGLVVIAIINKKKVK